MEGIDLFDKILVLSRFWVKAEEISILRSARGKVIALKKEEGK